MEKIITHYDPKPIPDRRHDWAAFRDGYDLGMSVGYGATEREAIEDLKEMEEAVRPKLTAEEMCKALRCLGESEQALDWLMQEAAILLEEQNAEIDRLKFKKRPVAFRIRNSAGNGWVLNENEVAASSYADAWGTEYQGLYVRDGT